MPDARYFVERLKAHGDAWIIKFDDEEYGPYKSQSEAVRFAIDAAEKLNEHGEKAQVVIMRASDDAIGQTSLHKKITGELVGDRTDAWPHIEDRCATKGFFHDSARTRRNKRRRPRRSRPSVSAQAAVARSP
jgi:Arc/MetJ-type ribon-helix-helix transcriptional regulator